MIFFLNWSIMALQCCVSFCCTTAWVIYLYIYIPSLLSLSWTPLPSRPSRSSQSARLVSLDYIQQLLPSYFTHGGVYISVLLSQFIPLSRRNCVCVCVCVCAHVLTQSYPTLCSPMNRKLPGSSVHGIFQARLLEWVAILFSRESSWWMDRTHVSYVSCIGRQILYH